MDTRRLLREWIVIEHVEQDGPPDAMGDPTEVVAWSRWRGYVWQTQADEQTANGQITNETWELILERTAADQLHAGDRIIQFGELDDDGNLVPNVGNPFDVAGPPWVARNPRTQLVEFVHARLDRSS